MKCSLAWRLRASVAQTTAATLSTTRKLPSSWPLNKLRNCNYSIPQRCPKVFIPQLCLEVERSCHRPPVVFELHRLSQTVECSCKSSVMFVVVVVAVVDAVV
jgi:hypothetical protein